MPQTSSFQPAASSNSSARWRLLGALDRLIFAMAGRPRDAFLLLAAWALFLSLIQIATLALSLTIGVNGQPRAMLILLFSAAGAWLFHDLNRERPQARSFLHFSKILSRTSIPERLAGRIVVFTGLIFTAFIVGFTLTHPDLSWDAMTYHIPPVHFWTLKGRVGWIDTYPLPTIEFLRNNPVMSGRTDIFMNGYPKAVELVSYVLVNALRHDQFLNLANPLFYPLAILGIAALARLLGASPWLAAAAGMLFPFIPVVVAQSVTNYNDIGMGAAAIGLLAATACCSLACVRGRIRALHGIGFACLAGLAPAVKYTGVPLTAMAVGVLVFFMVIGLMRRRAAGPRSARLARSVFFLFVTALGILLIAGYWYARNWKIAHNPLFPVQLTLFGRVIFDGVPSNQILLLGNDSFATIAHRVLIAWRQAGAPWPKSILPYDSPVGGIGFLWLYACVPAVILFAVILVARAVIARRCTVPQIAFWPLLLVTVALFRMTPSNYIARYVIWIYALGLPALAGVLAALGRPAAGVPRALLRLAAAALFLAGAFTLMLEGTIVYGHNREMYDSLFGIQKREGGVPKADWTPYDIAVCADGACRFNALLKECLGSNKPVAYGTFASRLQGMYIPGILSRPIGERPIYFLDERIMNDKQDFENFVMKNGIKFIILEGRPYPEPPPNVDAIDDAHENNGAFQVVKLP